MRSAFSTERTEDDYLTAIAGKTAALMATSCRIGALTGGLPPPRGGRAHRLRTRASAWSSRLRDDILDVVATDEELGKPAGQDLAEGIYTLPVLLALRDPGTGARAAAAARRARSAQPERDKARSIVAESRAIADAVTAASGTSTDAVDGSRSRMRRARGCSGARSATWPRSLLERTRRSDRRSRAAPRAGALRPLGSQRREGDHLADVGRRRPAA